LEAELDSSAPGVLASGRRRSIGLNDQLRRLRGMSPFYLAPPVACLVSGFLAVFVRNPNPMSFGDSAEYFNAARSLYTGHGFPRDTGNLWGFHPPLYPFTMSLVWHIHYGIRAVLVMQVLLFAATSLILVRLCSSLSQRRVVSVIAGSSLAVDPYVLTTVRKIESETLEMFLVALALLLVVEALQASARGRQFVLLLSGGIVLGLGALCRDATAAAVVLIALACGWIAHRRHHSRQNVRSQLPRFASVLWPATVLVGAVTVIAPWTLLNWRATGDLIPTSTLGGYNLWLGNNPAYIKLFDGHFANSTTFQRYSDDYLPFTLPELQVHAWGNRFKNASLGGKERLFVDSALHMMGNNLGTTAKLWAWKMWGFWRPWLHPLAYSKKAVLASGVLGILQYVAAALGIWWALRSARSDPLLFLLAALALSATLVSAVFISNVRYRVPLLEPYLDILAVTGVFALAKWSTERSHGPLNRIV
jgi:hypothetical protein